MKKLSKFIAVVAAMAMIMSMSVSVFAAGSGTDKDVPVAEIGGVEVQLESAEVTDEYVKELIDNPEKATEELTAVLNDAFKEDGKTVPKNAQIVVVDSIDLSLPAGTNIADVEKIELTIDLSDYKGKTVYIFHYIEGTETWEIWEADVDETGLVTIDPSSFSPFLIALIEKPDGTVGALEQAKAPADDDDKSYKTGEF